MQGIGVLLSVVGYAMLYAGYSQGFGNGGSFLYWLTGNSEMGAPAGGQGGGGSSTASSNPQRTPATGNATSNPYTNQGRPIAGPR